MTTIINKPAEGTGWSGLGMVLGAIVAIALIALFFIYALPRIREPQNEGGANINIDIPNPLNNNSGNGNSQ